MLVVGGLAAAAFGIFALRDEAPDWALRIKRPGRIVALGVALMFIGFVVNYYRFDFEEEFEAYTGRHADCEKLGGLEIDGADRDVYACLLADTTQRLGCYAYVDGEMVEVTPRAEAPGAFPGKTVDC